MNSFGRLFRISIFGESHGPGVGILIDGCPAGLTLAPEDFSQDLQRRRSGKPGTTARCESDQPLLRSGVFEGRTTGAPLLIWFENQDVASRDYEELRRLPRPGHADFVAHHKFGGFQDYRGGGHFSGRLTVAVVAAGVVAKKLIQPVEITAQLTEVGGSCDISASVRAALRDKDSIGGLIECRAKQVPVGLGEPFFDSLESLLGHLIFAIPGIKGIEFGAGFQAARMRGSEHNDLWINHQGQTRTNHAGGINGGISNGNDLFFRVAVKPTASIERPQQTIDLVTQEIKDLQITGRHDACFALRIPVIVEAATALVLADLLLIEQKIPKIVR